MTEEDWSTVLGLLPLTLVLILCAVDLFLRWYKDKRK